MLSTHELYRKSTFAVVFTLVIVIFVNYSSVTHHPYNFISRLQQYWRSLNFSDPGQHIPKAILAGHHRSQQVDGQRSTKGTWTPVLGWILHFNYEPHPEALQMLLHFYAKHFVSVVIVSPTGRIGKLLELNTSRADVEVIWAPPCDNKLHGYVAGVMMRCYARGLELLQKSANFQKVEYVVLSNDDVILNMSKVREFAREGRPVSHASPKEDAPLMFAPPPPADNEGKVPYFKGWAYAFGWPACQTAFSKVPQECKENYLNTQGAKALTGGCDVFFLPPEVVPEFIFLSTIVSECWLEMGIPNSLAMLSNPVKFYIPPSEVFMYRWWGILITPQIFEQQLANHSIVAFHPFKLSYPEHRTAFANFMTKYKFNEYY